MTFEEIIEHLQAQFPTEKFEIIADAKQPYIILQADALVGVCSFLHTDPKLYFDHLACITGVDNDVEAGTIDVIYHFTSIALGHTFIIKLVVSRVLEKNPTVPTLTTIWKGADWHERELFDFYGVKFSDHPDLRRILLPANWEGHPMRKDYTEQEYYHGIKVKY